MLVAVTGRPPDVSKTRRSQAFMNLWHWTQHVGLPFLVTTPEAIAMQSHQVSGWTFSQDGTIPSWEFATEQCEPVIYDAMYLADLKRHKTGYRRLLRNFHANNIPVFNPVLPAKDKVYRALMKRRKDEALLPKTWFDVTAEQVLRLLRETPRLWLKPTYGSGGRNMMFIRRVGVGRYQVIADRFYGERVRRELISSELATLITGARKYRRYMAQEHIALRETADFRKVDLRVTVQRDQTGKWGTTAMTGRCGAKGSVLTNYHAGGNITSLTERGAVCRKWLAGVGMTEQDLTRTEHCALTAARRVQRLDGNVGLLGLDIGQAEDGQHYVYDCNGRPGRDILTDGEVDAFMKAVAGFGLYLHNQRYS
jgi:YheC/D like ATP-grasp